MIWAAKKLGAIFIVLVLGAACASAWQFGIPGINPGKNNGTIAPPPPKKGPTTRSLTGTILSQHDAPLAHAVVYLKDTKTLAVKTYIANQDGSFQFNGLSPNQDYQIYAEFNGDRSGSKTLSSFDSRPNPTMNLHIEVKKGGGSS